MWRPSKRASSEIMCTLEWVYPVIEVLASSAPRSRDPEWCKVSVGVGVNVIPDPEWFSLLARSGSFWIKFWLMSFCDAVLSSCPLPSTGSLMLSECKIISTGLLCRLVLRGIRTESELSSEWEVWIRLPSEESDTISVMKRKEGRPIFVEIPVEQWRKKGTIGICFHILIDWLTLGI